MLSKEFHKYAGIMPGSIRVISCVVQYKFVLLVVNIIFQIEIKFTHGSFLKIQNEYFISFP